MDHVVLGVMAIAGVLTVGASVTGNGDRLCAAMGGTYTPENVHTNTNVCPGGSWANLFRSALPAPTPQGK